MGRATDRTTLILALAAVYFIWGSTYLALRFGLEGFPPLLLNGIRFLAAGVVMYVVLRWRGMPAPTRGQWWNSGRVAALMLVGAVGLVTVAEDVGVGSAVVATAVVITPVWAALVSGLFGSWPRRLEWLGLAVGSTGVVVLTREGDLQTSLLGMLLVIVAPILWALGSVWGTRLDMPRPAMATAAQLLSGGVVLLVLGIAGGERIDAVPTAGSVAALLYLTIFGSIIAYTAYVYLLERTRLAMATSYAYVNPAVAVLLGMTLGAEIVTGPIFIALPLIICGVAIITIAQRGRPDVEPEPIPSGDHVDEEGGARVALGE
jgi:drug/metabolite transporter (DMT)-like permease